MSFAGEVNVPKKIRELKAMLRRAGFAMEPGKGSHTKWKHPLVPGTVVLSGNDGDDAPHYHVKKVEKFVRQAVEAR